jgi:hypothetical protein
MARHCSWGVGFQLNSTLHLEDYEVQQRFLPLEYCIAWRMEVVAWSEQLSEKRLMMDLGTACTVNELID